MQQDVMLLGLSNVPNWSSRCWHPLVKMNKKMLNWFIEEILYWQSETDFLFKMFWPCTLTRFLGLLEENWSHSIKDHPTCWYEVAFIFCLLFYSKPTWSISSQSSLIWPRLKVSAEISKLQMFASFTFVTTEQTTERFTASSTLYADDM